MDMSIVMPEETTTTMPVQQQQEGPTKQQKRRAYLKNPVIKKAIETEHLTGVRYCSKCDKFLPLDQFRDSCKGKRQYICIPHIREKARIEAMGTKPKRAYNILRSMARPDMLEFGHAKMNLGRPTVIAMLSEEHINNPGEYCLMPKRPDRPLSVANSIIITRPQRLYLITRWRKSHDHKQYMRDLWHILEPEQFPGPTEGGEESPGWAQFFPLLEQLESSPAKN